MIDVHAHMTSSAFDNDLELVLEKAENSGIESILVAGEDYKDNLKVLELASKYDILKPCLGHYPANLDRSLAEKTVELIRENRNDVVAIGEVGLDYWKVQDEGDREIMRDIFTLFIGLSNELSLPLIVHSRSAGKYAIEMLSSANVRNVCLHAFDGKAGSAKIGMELGYYFSIPPSVVRSPQKQKLVLSLPLQNMLLETDSPVLSPDGESRNEPVNLIYAAGKIAELKKVSLQEVQAVIRENTYRLFSQLTGG